MTTAIDDPASRAASIPKAPFITLYVLAISLGLVPFALIIQSWLFLLITAVSVAVMAFIVTRTTNQYAGQRPASMEIALGLLGSSAMGVICGWFGIVVFIMIRFAIGLYDWLILSVPLSSWTSETAPAAPWAKYVSLIVPGIWAWFFAFAVSSDYAPKILRKLYPSLPDQRSPYFALAQQPKRLWLLWMQAALCVVAVGLVVSVPYVGQLARPFSGLVELVSYLGSVFGLFVLSAYWLTFTQDLWDTKSPDPPRARNQPLVRKIQTLMERAGYQVKSYPRTGNEESDPLVALLDFVAIRSDRSMAGGARGYADPALLRRELASLPSAVWALEDQLSKNRTAKIVLEPVLFLAGAASRAEHVAEVSAFAADLSVRIIDTTETELDAIIGDKDKERRATRARQLVDAPISNPAAPSEPTTASGLTT